MTNPLMRRTATAVAVAAILAACPAFAATPDNYIGGDGGLWSDPTNWSAGAPITINGHYDVVIDNGSPIQLTQDVSASIDSLSLSAPDTLRVNAARTLTLVGSSSTNTGTLNLSGTNSTLLFASNATLSGGGTILMNSSSSALFEMTLNDRIVTDNLIMGQGQVGSTGTKITNNGTITASAGTLTLQTVASADGFINNGVVGADAGTLLFSTGTLTTSGGILVSNGTLSAPTLKNTGIIQVDAGGVLSVNQLNSSGSITLQNAALTTTAASTFSGSFQATNSTLTLMTSSSPSLIPFNSNTVNIRGASTLDFANTTLILSGSNSALNLAQNVIIENATLGTRDGASITVTPSILPNANPTYFVSVALDDATIHLVAQELLIASSNAPPQKAQLLGTGTIVFDVPTSPPGTAWFGWVDTLAGSTLGLAGFTPGGGPFGLLGPHVSVVTGNFGGAVTVVENQGIISAQTPGTQIFLTANTNSGMTQALNGATLSYYTGVSTGVTNTGTISADGGAIILTTYHNISGVIQATNGGILSFSAGTATVTSPILLVDSTVVFADPAQFVAGVVGTGSINVAASSSLTSDGILGNSLSIAGTHTIRQNNATTGTSKLTTSLAIANTAGSFTGRLDVTTNSLILQSDPSTPTDKSNKLAFLSSALVSGFHNGDWLGTGITSSTVAADNAATGSHTTTLALYDNAVLNLSTLGGLSADSNSLFVTTALIADANFDGLVDKTDFDIWLAHAMTYAYADSAGDFNHDGAVDGKDFSLWFAHAAGAQAIVNGEGLKPEDLAALVLPPLTVPEPASIFFLAPLTAMLARRRRRQRANRTI